MLQQQLTSPYYDDVRERFNTVSLDTFSRVASDRRQLALGLSDDVLCIDRSAPFPFDLPVNPRLPCSPGSSSVPLDWVLFGDSGSVV